MLDGIRACPLVIYESSSPNHSQSICHYRPWLMSSDQLFYAPSIPSSMIKWAACLLLNNLSWVVLIKHRDMDMTWPDSAQIGSLQSIFNNCLQLLEMVYLNVRYLLWGDIINMLFGCTAMHFSLVLYSHPGWSAYFKVNGYMHERFTRMTDFAISNFNYRQSYCRILNIMSP